MCDGKLSSTADGLSRDVSCASLPGSECPSLPETECAWDRDAAPQGLPPRPPGHFESAPPPTCYQVAYPGGLEVRAGVGYAPRTGLVLAHGETFVVSQRLAGTDGRIYLYLADGRGWVFDDTSLVPHDPSVVQVPYAGSPMPAMQEALPVLYVPGPGGEAVPPALPAPAPAPAPLRGELLASTPVGAATSAAAQSLGSLAGAAPGVRWYRVAYAGGISLRCAASIDAPFIGETLPQHETFSVSEEVHAPDGRVYLCLSDGRGWVFDDSALMPHDPAVVRGNWVSTLPHHFHAFQTPQEGQVQAEGLPIRRRLHAQPRGKRGGKRCSRRSKAWFASASTPVEG